ncbi:hypothetical protein GTY54_48035 [Streptomyces sp. SID625]|nr:hypothetical protein [Streptomyces sp. SID625]
MTTHRMPEWARTASVARICDHLDGGTDNYAADRAVGDELRTVAPWLPAAVRTNRAHGPRVLACLTRDYGVDQVVDLGCGLPHDDNRNVPDAVARILYVDHDPHVEGHARMVLAEREGTASLRADLRDMPALWDAEQITQLDHTRLIGVLLHDVLPWLSDYTARLVLTTLHARLPAGSVISLTHAVDEVGDAGGVRRLVDVYERAGIAFRPRTVQHIRALLSSWTLLEDPVPTGAWRCPGVRPLHGHDRHAYAVLARKEAA